jgi:hypothetical protein
MNRRSASAAPVLARRRRMVARSSITDACAPGTNPTLLLAWLQTMDQFWNWVPEPAV